ncbi:P-loop NTPase fold protein [Acinetobacter indicus]|uniref:P-loop NTPase fold protein n=1 Tax=Acinetobacter indicus TaxID=756892 RepID=UPI00257728E2|nr:P-loop NTPase fold protein [Acinetobacter indicus]MDM1491174.1 KAP family P-loop domain protein [Acinetobacter indicus]
MNSEERLRKIFIENENKGMAIAITGSWGVGKTFFWNEFRKNSPNKKKYVYVSLFGLESLSDLKTHIYSHIENNNSAIEIPRWIRGLPSILKETRISQFGISSSAKIFDSLMFNQVKDAIICFDDFERMSNKLDIKDVMGLANQLKLERNCQVILILDESKTEKENKRKYAEYKEKLIDEEIKITSVEPLLRENAKDIDEPLIDLMVEFAEKLEIHNFRFFQKVIKLYGKFIEQLPNEVAYSTKKIILIRVLQGYFIEDFGKKYEFGWEDVKLVFEDKQKDWPEIKQKTYESLKLIAYDFVYADEWLIEFKRWFDQKGELNFSRIYELANSELISEKNNQIRDDLDNLMEEWRNFEVDNTFCMRLYKAASQIIGIENLENLAFYCKLLMEFGDKDLSEKLQNNINNWLSEEYDSKGYLFSNEQFSFDFNEDNQFYSYLKNLEKQKPYQGLPTLIEVIYRYIEHNGSNSLTDPKVLELATKQDWKKLIFIDIPKDERFNDFNKLRILRKILNQQISTELQPKINTLIFEVLKDEARTSSVLRCKNIEYVIRRLKE